MTILEIIVTKAHTLEKSIGAIQAKGIPNQFNRDFLESIGFTLPNSVHYVSLFKGLGLVDKSGQPVLAYYSSFVESQECSKIIIAERVKQAYSKVFEKEPYCHKIREEQVYKIFRDLMGKEKSATFVHLVADTFMALCRYADWSGGAKPLPDPVETEFEPEEKAPSFEPSEFSPQKEFIMELINGDSDHSYSSNVAVLTHEEGDKKKQPDRRVIVTSTAKNNSEKVAPKQTIRPHEEFIVELINGYSDHQYSEVSNPLSKIDSEADDSPHPQNGKSKPNNATSVESVTTVIEFEQDEELLYHDDSTQEHKDASEMASTSTKKGDLNKNLTAPSKSTLFKKALFRRTELLLKLGQYKDAVNAFDEIMGYVTNTDQTIPREKIVELLYRKAHTLEHIERYDEAIKTYDDLIKHNF